MNLSTKSEHNPGENRRASTDGPASTPLHATLVDQQSSNGIWAVLIVVAFIAGVVTGLGTLFVMAGPL